MEPRDKVLISSTWGTTPFQSSSTFGILTLWRNSENLYVFFSWFTKRIETTLNDLAIFSKLDTISLQPVDVARNGALPFTVPPSWREEWSEGTLMSLVAATQRAGKSIPDVAPTNLILQAFCQQVTMEAAEEWKIGSSKTFFTCRSEGRIIMYESGSLSVLERKRKASAYHIDLLLLMLQSAEHMLFQHDGALQRQQHAWPGKQGKNQQMQPISVLAPSPSL